MSQGESKWCVGVIVLVNVTIVLLCCCRYFIMVGYDFRLHHLAPQVDSFGGIWHSLILPAQDSWIK